MIDSIMKIVVDPDMKNYNVALVLGMGSLLAINASRISPTLGMLVVWGDLLAATGLCLNQFFGEPGQQVTGKVFRQGQQLAGQVFNQAQQKAMTLFGQNEGGAPEVVAKKQASLPFNAAP